MVLNEMILLFLDSRKRGVGQNSKCECSPKTIKIYESNMRTFETFLLTGVGDGGVTKYTSITRLHMMRFLDWVKQKEASGWSKATSLQILRTLRTFFRWVDQDEDCQAMELKGLQRYLPKISKNPRRVDIPPIATLKTFKNGFDTDSKWGYRDYVATCLLLDTGVRLGEVCSLRVDRVLFEQRTMLVEGKTGPRLVPLTNNMIRLLKGWMRRRTTCTQAEGSPYVFVSKYSPQMSVNGFGQSFRKHRKEMGLPRVSAHTFRHTFATNYLRKGGDIEKLRSITGHTTYEMLKDYLHHGQMGSQPVLDEMEKVSLLKEV